ncbi:hypothetical protein C8R47DRAFT_1321515 [Mycena vitilis]|nr:hypothetical protein C8R47DRAFT_1321515 [Mycena vitilis]
MGAFVVLSIDPVASLDADVLGDPEAVAACKQLVNKKYVALAERNGFYRPWDLYNECEIGFVLQGEPRSSPRDFMEPSMSLPIEPVTIAPHASSRPPLQPSIPLPWNDCYLSTFFAATVRSPTLFTEEPVPWVLGSKELSKRDNFLRTDVMRHRELEEIHKQTANSNPNRVSVPKTPPQRPSSIHSVLDSEPPTADPDPDQASVARASPQRPSSPHSVSKSEHGTRSPESMSFNMHGDDDEDGTSSVEEDFDSTSSARPAPQSMTTVTFSHDLLTVKELNNPDDFFKEIDAIARIAEDAKRRLAETKARVIDHARKLDTAAYDERTVDLLVARILDPTMATEGADPSASAGGPVEASSVLENKVETVAEAHCGVSDATIAIKSEPSAAIEAKPSLRSLTRLPACSPTNLIGEKSVPPPVSQKVRGRIARIAARLNRGRKTIVYHVTRLFCTPCSSS